MNSLILRVGARLLVGLMLLFSLYVLLRGHNTPGGGFIGGLIAAAGFVLYAFAAGVPAARKALRVDPRMFGVLGMALAIVSGLWSALPGVAPFTGIWGSVMGYDISTVMLFDIGVYCSVFGAMLTLVFAMEEMV